MIRKLEGDIKKKFISKYENFSVRKHIYERKVLPHEKLLVTTLENPCLG